MSFAWTEKDVNPVLFSLSNTLFYNLFLVGDLSPSSHSLLLFSDCKISLILITCH